MNFIAKNIHIVGLLFLTAFLASAAAMYLDLPAKLSRTPDVSVAAKYSCPMHPDVISQRPGECPKCGMALTKASSEGNKHEGCNHAMADAANDPNAAAEPAGCAHAASGGGCCSTPAQPATNSIPQSGCTRSLYPQPETASP